MPRQYVSKIYNKNSPMSYGIGDNFILFFKISDHVDSSLVLATLKLAVNKDVSKLYSKPLAYYSCAEAEYVCIIVKSCELSAEDVRAACRANSLKLVCRHAHADTCTTAEDGEVSITVKHLAATCNRKIGIITAVGVVCSVVDGVDAACVKMTDKSFLQGVTCVVGSKCDSFFVGTHCEISFLTYIFRKPVAASYKFSFP